MPIFDRNCPSPTSAGAASNFYVETWRGQPPYDSLAAMPVAATRREPAPDAMAGRLAHPGDSGLCCADATQPSGSRNRENCDGHYELKLDQIADFRCPAILF